MSRKPVFIAIGILVLLLAIRIGVGFINQPDDRALIKQAIDDSVQASRQGKPGGVLDLLSRNFKFNDIQLGNSGQVANLIRESKPELSISNLAPIVTGDDARLTTPIDLKLNLLGHETSGHINDVHMVFKKEEAREWLVIPTHKWRLVEITAPPDALSQFIQ